jgi:hypothetical protein
MRRAGTDLGNTPVDDIELDGVPPTAIPEGTSAPLVTPLVSGHVLATRIFGRRPPRSRLEFISWDLISTIAVVITLRPTDQEFDELWVKRWVASAHHRPHPGDRHAPN